MRLSQSAEQVLALTYPFSHILLAMLLCILIALSVGIEGGYNEPALGFNNIKSGTAFTLFMNRHLRLADVTLSIGTGFHTGDNPSYSLDSYGLRCGLSKNDWLFSPVIEFGADYLRRTIHNANESGFAYVYTIGLVINFRYERVRLYPKFYYEGLTDFKEHGGFIGTKLGIGYEI